MESVERVRVKRCVRVCGEGASGGVCVERVRMEGCVVWRG